MLHTTWNCWSYHVLASLRQRLIKIVKVRAWLTLLAAHAARHFLYRRKCPAHRYTNVCTIYIHKAQWHTHTHIHTPMHIHKGCGCAGWQLRLIKRWDAFLREIHLRQGVCVMALAATLILFRLSSCKTEKNWSISGLILAIAKRQPNIEKQRPFLNLSLFLLSFSVIESLLFLHWCLNISENQTKREHWNLNL